MSDNLHFLLTRKEMLEGILNKIRNDGQDNGTTFFLIPTWWIDSIDDFVGNGFIGQKPNMHLDFRIKLKIEEYLTIDIVHWNYLRETFGVTYVGNPIKKTKEMEKNCLICRKKFTCPGTLKNHNYLYHSTNIKHINCPEDNCTIRCKEQKAMNRHIREQHV